VFSLKLCFLCVVSKRTKPTPAFLRLFGSPAVKGNIIKVSFDNLDKIAVILNKIIIIAICKIFIQVIYGASS
jgi:hypothetical protein